MLDADRPVDRAKRRAADVLDTTEVGLHRIFAQTVTPKASFEGSDRVEVNPLGGVPQRSNAIETHSLQLLLRNPFGCHCEAEVRRPRDRRLRIAQSTKPERGPPHEILWLHHH